MVSSSLANLASGGGEGNGDDKDREIDREIDRKTDKTPSYDDLLARYSKPTSSSSPTSSGSGSAPSKSASSSDDDLLSRYALPKKSEPKAEPTKPSGLSALSSSTSSPSSLAASSRSEVPPSFAPKSSNKSDSDRDSNSEKGAHPQQSKSREVRRSSIFGDQTGTIRPVSSSRLSNLAAAAATTDKPASASEKIDWGDAENDGEKKPEKKPLSVADLIEDPDYDKKIHKIDKRTGELKFYEKGNREGQPKYAWSYKKKAAVFAPLGAVGAFLMAFVLMFVFSIQGSISATGMEGNVLDVMRKSPLQLDKFGRVNLLLFGTTEDEAGHGGAQLADTIMVLSIDPETGAANTVSLPRDLWHHQDGDSEFGVGSWTSKLNVGYFYGMGGKKKSPAAGAAYFAKVISGIIGTNIPYYVKVDMGGLMSIVNVVGGVDVHPHTQTPSRGLFDVNQSITIPVLKDGETIHLDGDKALRLSRSRNSDGGYGLPASNFDREINQQIILNAVKEKALSTGFITNPVNVAQFIQGLGTHILTNLKMSEVGTLLDVAKKMQKTVGIPLQGKDEDGKLVTLVVNGSNEAGASIVRPAIGANNYSEIQSNVAWYFSGGKQGEKKKGTVVGDAWIPDSSGNKVDAKKAAETAPTAAPSATPSASASANGCPANTYMWSNGLCNAFPPRTCPAGQIQQSSDGQCHDDPNAKPTAPPIPAPTPSVTCWDGIFAPGTNCKPSPTPTPTPTHSTTTPTSPTPTPPITPSAG